MLCYHQTPNQKRHALNAANLPVFSFLHKYYKSSSAKLHFISPGARDEQRSYVLGYVEAEEAGEPQDGVYEAGREEELGVLEEWES